MKKALALLTRIVLVGLLTAACQDDGMVIAEQISTEPGASGSTMISADRTELEKTEIEKAAVKDLLLDSCGACHGDTATRPPHARAGVVSRDGQDPIADIEDIDGLVSAGLIMPGMPEDSPLLFAIASGQMPPAGSGLPPLGVAELRRVEKFIVRLDPPSQVEVIDILLRNCGICHDRAGEAQPVIAINDIANVGVLVAAGLIVPGDRDLSQLYNLVLDGDMPPAGAGVPPVSRRDLARLGGFIDLLSEVAQSPSGAQAQPKTP
jgi:cytochrome c553